MVEHDGTFAKQRKINEKQGDMVTKMNLNDLAMVM